MIRGKLPATRELFDAMAPELRAAAVVITGVEDLHAIERVRNLVAAVPEGEDWAEAKRRIVGEVSDWLGDGEAAESRAELLLRSHGYAAYAKANWAALEDQREIFPWRKYQTAQDERVRGSHAALDGLILPADSPFWLDHTPPWEFGCRCDVVGLTDADVAELRESNLHTPEGRPAIKVIDRGPELEALEAGNLYRDGVMNFVARNPDGFRFDPRGGLVTLEMLEGLQSRVGPKIWTAFQDWARNAEVPGAGDAWEYLTKRARRPKASFRSPLLPDPVGGTLWIDDEAYEELRSAAAESGYRRGPGLELAPGDFAELEAREMAKLRPATVEESVLLTEAGEWIAKTGLVDRVSHDRAKLPGAVMTHRHPADSPPGGDDVAEMLLGQMKAVRVVASERIYTITPGPVRAAEFSDADEFKSGPEFQSSMREAFATVQRVAEGYGLSTKQQREHVATHLTMVGLARRGIIGYVEELK